MKLRELTFEQSVLLLVALNLFDAASTHAALVMGIAYEVNPLVAWVFNYSPHLFWAIKLVVLGTGLLIIASLPNGYAKQVASAANIIYFLVLLTHLFGWAAYIILGPAT